MRSVFKIPNHSIHHHIYILLTADKATTMGHIKREELDKAEVVIPDDKTYSKLTREIVKCCG